MSGEGYVPKEYVQVQTQMGKLQTGDVVLVDGREEVVDDVFLHDQSVDLAFSGYSMVTREFYHRSRRYLQVTKVYRLKPNPKGRRQQAEES